MRFPGTRIAALLVWALAALPVLFAQEVAVGGFVRLDHYGGVAEESFYSNERVRLTALSQLRADDEAGFWSAFLEVVAHLQYDEEGFSVAPGALTARAIDDMIRRAYVSLPVRRLRCRGGQEVRALGQGGFPEPAGRDQPRQPRGAGAWRPVRGAARRPAAARDRLSHRRVSVSSWCTCHSWPPTW